jgi:hypothetical protein
VWQPGGISGENSKDCKVTLNGTKGEVECARKDNFPNKNEFFVGELRELLRDSTSARPGEIAETGGVGPGESGPLTTVKTAHAPGYWRIFLKRNGETTVAKVTTTHTPEYWRVSLINDGVVTPAAKAEAPPNSAPNSRPSHHQRIGRNGLPRNSLWGTPITSLSTYLFIL